MAIETNCPGCSRRLRVSDEHAGKTARCPACQTLYTIPPAGNLGPPAGNLGPPAGNLGPPAGNRGPSLAASPTPGLTELPSQGDFAGLQSAGLQPLPTGPSSSPPKWRLRTEDGAVYGPVERSELNNWVAQGRVTPGAQVQQEGDGYWQQAATVFPALAAVGTASAPDNPFAAQPANPFAELPESRGHYGVNPYGQPTYGAGTYSPARGRRYREAHRGGLVLAMGLLGWVIGCPFFGPIAILLGIVDLRKMRDGIMDPSGKGLTIAGVVMGSIHTVLMVGVVVMIVLAAALD